jgi:hypothetical protein
VKTYSLIHLDDNLCRAGVARQCLRYSLSGDNACLHIVYLDNYLREQYISVFRTSRLCYRIYCNGVMTSKRTCRETAEHLAAVLSELIEKNDYYKTITVAELASLSDMTYTARLNLFRRNELRNRENKA